MTRAAAARQVETRRRVATPARALAPAAKAKANAAPQASSAAPVVVPIDRRRVASAQAHDHLRHAIVTGELRPRQRISENEIAQLLGVSRTPVREAFIRLSEEGLLLIYPQSGTEVAPIDLDAVADSQFLRETLECRTIAVAAERCAPAEARALGALINAQRAAIADGDHQRFVLADDDMHRLLVEMSGRRSVWKVVQDAKSQLDRVRYLSVEDPAWLAKIFREHREIVRRVVEGDARRAEAAMRAHLRTVFAAMDRIAAVNREFFKEGQAASGAKAARRRPVRKADNKKNREPTP